MEVPSEIWHQIILNSDAVDCLSLICTCRYLHNFKNCVPQSYLPSYQHVKGNKITLSLNTKTRIPERVNYLKIVNSNTLNKRIYLHESQTKFVHYENHCSRKLHIFIPTHIRKFKLLGHICKNFTSHLSVIYCYTLGYTQYQLNILNVNYVNEHLRSSLTHDYLHLILRRPIHEISSYGIVKLDLPYRTRNGMYTSDHETLYWYLNDSFLRALNVHTLILRKCDHMTLNYISDKVHHLILIGRNIHIHRNLHRTCKIYHVKPNTPAAHPYYDHSLLTPVKSCRTYFR